MFPTVTSLPAITSDLESRVATQRSRPQPSWARGVFQFRVTVKPAALVRTGPLSRPANLRDDGNRFVGSGVCSTMTTPGEAR
jgi:hypothetical protein